MSGVLILLLAAASIYFGIAYNVLEHLGLTDSQALLIIGLMIGGSFIDIPLLTGRTEISINMGGAVVPLALAVYFFSRADSYNELFRGFGAVIITTGVVYGISQVINLGLPQREIIHPIWFFGIISGITGFLTAKSHRHAFTASTFGIILTDIIHLVKAYEMNLPAIAAIGGRGVFDTVIFAGLAAVSLVEIVGENRIQLNGTSED